MKTWNVSNWLMMIQALKYIKNTNGGATKEIFIDDFAPIGGKLWYDICPFVVEWSDGSIWLNDEGEKHLKDVS